MHNGSSAHSYRGPITSALLSWWVDEYIKVAFSSENVADFFIDVEMFFVEVFDHGGVLLAQSLCGYFNLELSTDTR
jgi:hypothetical protein